MQAGASFDPADNRKNDTKEMIGGKMVLAITERTVIFPGDPVPF